MADPGAGDGGPGGTVTARPGLRARLAHPVAAPLGLLLAGLAGCGYLWGTNPHHSGALLPRCPFNWLTTLDCPACGATRMVYDLIHADLAAAWQDNAALLLALPLVLAVWGRWLVEGARGRRYRLRLSARGTALVVTVAVVWGVARNLA